MLGGYAGGWVVAMTPLLIPFSTAAVGPMTPIMYSSAKLKHQTLNRERHATAAHADNQQSGTERRRREERIADGEVDPVVSKNSIPLKAE